MGGALAGLPSLPNEAKIVDLGCGPGGWVLDVAFERPDVEVCGIDSSKRMIDYANARARSQGLSTASFGIMDITQPLDFSDGSFDLVNARFLAGVLRKDAWQVFVAECTRILRPGGILRLTEAYDMGDSSSVGLNKWHAMSYPLLQHGGYGFSTDARTFGIVHVLPQMLRRTGYHKVQQLAHTVDFSKETDEWANYFDAVKNAYKEGMGVLVKAGLVSREEIGQLHEQVIHEMQAEDFSAVWISVSVWGRKAGEGM